MKSSSGEVNLWLLDLQKGDADAAARLMPLVYAELRRLAARYLRLERPGHTLQATELVHEAYLKLLGQHPVTWESRVHFFGIASRLMREILVEHARKRQALKRGGLQRNVQLEDTMGLAAPNRSIELVALNEALQRLEKIDPQQGRIVELRFFAGLSVEETATAVGVAPRTVKRDWNMARLWLHREMARQ